MRDKSVFSFLLFSLIMSCQYSTETYKEGKSLFEFQCAPCHGNRAEGFGTLYPNLLHLDYIKANRSNIPCWIRNGIGPDSTNAKHARFSDQTMPAIKILSAIDICNILNYINSNWWKTQAFTLQEIENNLKSCEELKMK